MPLRDLSANVREDQISLAFIAVNQEPRANTFQYNIDIEPGRESRSILREETGSTIRLDEFSEREVEFRQVLDRTPRVGELLIVQVTETGDGDPRGESIEVEITERNGEIQERRTTPNPLQVDDPTGAPLPGGPGPGGEGPGDGPGDGTDGDDDDDGLDGPGTGPDGPGGGFIPPISDIGDEVESRVEDDFDDVEAKVDREAELTRDELRAEGNATRQTVRRQSAQVEAEIDDLPTREEIGEELEDEVTGPLGETLAEVRAGVEDIDFPSVSDIVDPIAEALEALRDRILGALGEVEEEITDGLADVRENVETAIDQSVDELEEDVSGLSGALSSIGDVVGDIRDDVTEILDGLGTALDRLPEDFEGAIESALEAAQPTVDGAGLFTDPVGFVVGVIDQAVDVVVDDETTQNLQAAIEEVEADQEEVG